MNPEVKTVDIELARDKLSAVKDKLYECGLSIPGFQARNVIAQAETQTVMDILILHGICTEVGYVKIMEGHIQDVIDELVDAGFVDATVNDE